MQNSVLLQIPFIIVLCNSCDDTLKNTLLASRCKHVFFPVQVMDKYGDFYGCEKISELLGLDKAALDLNSETKTKKRLKRDAAWSAL